jgi:hypothetical protein
LTKQRIELATVARVARRLTKLRLKITLSARKAIDRAILGRK